MRWCLCVVLLAVASVARGQQFSVQDSGGKTYGPFEFKEGSRIKARRAELTISNVRTSEDAVLDKVNKIRLPAVDFQHTSLEEVVRSLQKASVEADKEKKGVNLVLDMSGVFEEHPEREWSGRQESDAATNEIPRISFSGRDITLRDGLGALEFLAGMKYRVQGNLVVICPTNAPDAPIIVRRYDVLSAFNEISERTREEINASCGTANDSRRDIKDVFGELGVKWPIGSSIKHVPSIGKLIVANTEANLADFEKVLRAMGVVPGEIQIEIDFVAFDKADVGKLGPGGICQEALLGLWTNGHAELIAAPRVITRSGQEATVKGVTEYIYPTEFAFASEGLTNTNTVVCHGGGIAPCGFETREVGVIMSAMAEVSPDNSLVYITMTPEYVQEPVWRKYPAVWMSASGKKETIEMEQPFFHTYTLTTSASLYDGATLLVGGGIPSKDERKMIFVFLTVRLVDPHGKPLLGR